MSASQNEARYNLLQPSTSDLSDLSASTLTGGSPVPFSPPSSARHRPGYQRLASDVIEEHPRDEEEDDIADTFRRHAGSAGLGIAGGAPSSSKTRRVSIQSITRVPVGAKAESRISGTPAPGSADALVSPLTPGVFLSSPEESPGLSKTEGYNKFPSVSSLHSSFAQPYAPYVDSSDTERLKKTRTAASVRSTTSAYDGKTPITLQYRLCPKSDLSSRLRTPSGMSNKPKILPWPRQLACSFHPPPLHLLNRLLRNIPRPCNSRSTIRAEDRHTWLAHFGQCNPTYNYHGEDD